jgi:hypothetical protein
MCYRPTDVTTRKKRPNRAAASLRAMGTPEGAAKAARARAASLSTERRREIAQKAAKTRWAKKGSR